MFGFHRLEFKMAEKMVSVFHTFLLSLTLLFFVIIVLLSPGALTLSEEREEDYGVVAIDRTQTTTTVDPPQASGEEGHVLRLIGFNNNGGLLSDRFCAYDDRWFTFFTYEKLLVPKFFSECSDKLVQKDNSDPFVESLWLYVDCLVSKGLAGKPLTLQNFARLMTTNLTQSKRAGILSRLEKFESVATTNLTEIWATYFDAEFRECVNVTQFSPFLAQSRYNLSEKWLRNVSVWAPESGCGTRMAPHVTPVVLTGKPKYLENCKNSLKIKYGLNHTKSMNFPLFTICESLWAGLIQESDLQLPVIPFEEIYSQKVVPKYWPLAAQTAAMEALNKYIYKCTQMVRDEIDAAQNLYCYRTSSIFHTTAVIRSNFTMVQNFRKLKRQEEQLLEFDPTIPEPTNVHVNMKLISHAYGGLLDLMDRHCEYVEQF